MKALANTLTLKVMAEVVRRCSESHGYVPSALPKNEGYGRRGQPATQAVLDGHPRQAKLLSDIASGKRRLGQLEPENSHDSPSIQTVTQKSAQTGPMSLNDWLSNQQKRR